MKKYWLVAVIMLVFCLEQAESTHIVGGEINYTYLGNDNYQIKLAVYRDCANGQAAYDDPASLGIFNSSGTLLIDERINLGVVDIVPSNVSNPCLIAPNNICYEVTTYQTIVNLPPIAGGYQLVYQRCCRNHTIQNIVDPNNAGATYYATIPGTSLSNNSNPIFTELPPIYICNQNPFYFDHSAIDPDGDSLLYELYTPWDGNFIVTPMPQPPGAPSGNPPYPPISWLSPYSLSNVMGGVPLSIDPQTGILTATPNTLGQFVFGVRVKEYRNGVYLGSTQRDFQANIESCPAIPVIAQPSAPPNVITCDPPYIVDFTSTGNYPEYYWDFGDGNSSTSANPTHTYADTGTYNVMFVAIDSSTCNISDTAYLTVTLLEKEEFSAEFNIPLFDPCDDSLFVNLEFTGTGADSIVWNMGDGTIIYNDTMVNYFYTTPGTYVITMTAYDLLCNNTGTISQTVNFNPTFSYAQANAPPNVFSCEPPYEVDFTTTGTPPPPHVFWDFGDGIGTSNLANITYIYADTGTYEVMYVAIDSSTCNIADTAYFTVQFELAEEFNATFDIPVLPACRTSDSLWVQLDFTGSGADSIVWDMGDGNVFINDTVLNYLYLDPGDYLITMTAYDFKCNNIGTITELVQFTGTFEGVFVPNAFTPNGDGNNDVLYVRGLGITEVQLFVYDRWGEKVFETNSQDKGWDGKYEGMLVDPGIFAYYLNIIFCDGEKYFEKGNISLIK